MSELASQGVSKPYSQAITPPRPTRPRCTGVLAGRAGPGGAAPDPEPAVSASIRRFRGRRRTLYLEFSNQEKQKYGEKLDLSAVALQVKKERPSQWVVRVSNARLRIKQG